MIRRGARFLLGIALIAVPFGSAAAAAELAVARDDLALVPAQVPEIAGIVVDEAGKPLAGAEVLLVNPWYWGDPQQSRRVNTSQAGAFRITPLQAGELYALTATRSGFAPTTLLVTAQIPSQKLSATRLILRRGRTVSGLVVDPRQRPVAGAAVKLISTRPREDLDKPRPQLGPFLAATGPDGRFRIPHLPAGLFELRIEGPDLAPLPKKEISVPGGVGPVNLGSFTLERRTPIAGWIIDREGQPLGGVEIWVVPEERSEITLATYQAGPAAVTGADGRYKLRDRGVGDHEHLRACRKGYVPEEFPAKGGASESPRTVLARAVQLTGRVVGAGGGPLAGARVSASPSGQSASDVIVPDPPCPFVSSGLTDAEGAFALELAGPGRYDAGASCAGQLSNNVPHLKVPPEGLTGVEIQLHDGATASGHVADPEGHPISGASISASGPRSYVSAASDGGGNFLLEGVAPGESFVSVSHDDFAQEERKVQIGPEGAQIQFVLHPVRHLELRGRVIGPDGAPIAGVLITDKRCRCRSTSTQVDGSFLMRADPGVVELFAEKDGFAPVKTSGVTVADRSIDGVEIRLGYGLTLTGRVLGIDPAAVGKISVFLPSVFSFREAPVDSEGRFQVPNLPPGEWGLSAQSGDRFASDRFVPPAGLMEVAHDLQFPPVSEIRGRVAGPGGEPIEGASLWFRGSSLPNFTTHSLADGSFAVGVTDGTYTLSVSAEGYSGRHAEQPIVVAGAPVEDVEIQLGTNIVLSGRTLGLEPGDTLQSLNASGPPGYDRGAWTYDQEGHYRQIGLWPGDWTITAVSSSGSFPFGSIDRRATGRVHIPSGATEATLDLDFHIGNLTLSVRSESPGEAFRATLLNTDGSELIREPFGQNGAFLFQRLQPGAYRLRIEDPLGKKTSQELPVELTADREVVIDLQATNPEKKPTP